MVRNLVLGTQKKLVRMNPVILLLGTNNSQIWIGNRMYIVETKVFKGST